MIRVRRPPQDALQFGGSETVVEWLRAIGRFKSVQPRSIEESHPAKLALVVEEQSSLVVQAKDEMHVGTGLIVGGVDLQAPRHTQVERQGQAGVKVDQQPFGPSPHGQDAATGDLAAKGVNRRGLDHAFPVETLNVQNSASNQLLSQRTGSDFDFG